MEVKPNNQLYFTQLDSLRFIAFLLVFLQHGFADTFFGLAKNNIINGIILNLTLTGGVGVHIFFVISGFLITYLMIKENAQKGSINIKNFYLRRLLRIWPLYYLLILSGIFIFPYLLKEFHFSGNWYNLIFLNNFDFKSLSSNNISVAWSVAIEEQFYLFWPLLFAFIRNKSILIFVCFIIFGLSTFFSFNSTYPISYMHTFSNLNYLMAGCIGAFIYHNPISYQILKKVMKPKIFFSVIILAITLILVEGTFIFNAFMPLTCLILLPFIWLFFVIYLVNGTNTKPPSIFSKLGKYTYGMYLYHPIMLILFRTLFDSFHWNYYLLNRTNNIILGSIALAFTIGISILSYNYFEKYFLKLKAKFSIIKTRI